MNHFSFYFLQQNALRSITPATLDVLLGCVSLISQQKAPSEKQQQMIILKKLVLKCIVRMVHVIHCSCPDQVSTANVFFNCYLGTLVLR